MEFYNHCESTVFEVYGHADGHLSLPSGDEEAPAAQDITQLPYPLQALAERWWCRCSDFKSYLVRHNQKFGLMLESAVTCQENRRSVKPVDRIRRLEAALALFCPPAKVVVDCEDNSGKINAVQVFLPADTGMLNLKDAHYIMSLYSTGNHIPVRRIGFYGDSYCAWSKVNDFSVLPAHGPSMVDPHNVILAFDGPDEFAISVLVPRHAVSPTGVFDAAEVGSRFYALTESIYAAAREAGETPDPDTVVVRACNVMFRREWTLLLPDARYSLEPNN